MNENAKRLKACKESQSERAIRIKNEKAFGLSYSRIVPTKKQKQRKDCRKKVRLYEGVY
jgi:hypothetical protein